MKFLHEEPNGQSGQRKQQKRNRNRRKRRKSMRKRMTERWVGRPYINTYKIIDPWEGGEGTNTKALAAASMSCL